MKTSLPSLPKAMTLNEDSGFKTFDIKTGNLKYDPASITEEQKSAVLNALRKQGSPFLDDGEGTLTCRELDKMYPDFNLKVASALGSIDVMDKSDAQQIKFHFLGTTLTQLESLTQEPIKQQYPEFTKVLSEFAQGNISNSLLKQFHEQYATLKPEERFTLSGTGFTDQLLMALMPRIVDIIEADNPELPALDMQMPKAAVAKIKKYQAYLAGEEEEHSSEESHEEPKMFQYESVVKAAKEAGIKENPKSGKGAKGYLKEASDTKDPSWKKHLTRDAVEHLYDAKADKFRQHHITKEKFIEKIQTYQNSDKGTHNL